MTKDEYDDFTLTDYRRACREIQSISPVPFVYKTTIPSADLTTLDPHYVLIRLLTELDRQGKLDFILLKDQEIAKFWAQHQERVRITQVYKQARAKLETVFSDEERRLLGIDMSN